jgi:hypothetical protein
MQDLDFADGVAFFVTVAELATAAG